MIKNASVLHGERTESSAHVLHNDNAMCKFF